MARQYCRNTTLQAGQQGIADPLVMLVRRGPAARTCVGHGVREVWAGVGAHTFRTGGRRSQQRWACGLEQAERQVEGGAKQGARMAHSPHQHRVACLLRLGRLRTAVPCWVSGLCIAVACWVGVLCMVVPQWRQASRRGGGVLIPAHRHGCGAGVGAGVGQVWDRV